MDRIFVFLSALLLTACSTVNTSWDYDPKTNFSLYSGYAWVNHDNKSADYNIDGLTEARVKQALEKELEQKGLQKTTLEQANLLVNFITQVENKMRIDTYTNLNGYKPYYPYYGAGWNAAYSHSQINLYKESTLLIDFIDAKTKALVWRGSLVDSVKTYDTPQQRIEAIEQKVNTLLANYPPNLEQ